MRPSVWGAPENEPTRNQGGQPWRIPCAIPAYKGMQASSPVRDPTAECSVSTERDGCTIGCQWPCRAQYGHRGSRVLLYTIIYCVSSIHTTSGPPSSAQWPCRAQYGHRGSNVHLWHRTQKARIVDTYYIGSTIICPVAVPSTVRAPRVQRPSVALNTKDTYRRYILDRVHHHLPVAVPSTVRAPRVHHHLSRIVDTYYIGSTIICPVAVPSTVRALRVQRPSVASNTKGVPLSIAYRRYIIHRVHHHLLRIFDTYYIGYTIIYRVSSIHTTSGTPSSIAYCRYILHRVHHHLPSDRAEHSTCTAGPTSFFGIEHKRRTTLYRISSIHTTSGTPSSIAYLRYILHRVHHHLSRIVDTYYIRYTIIYCVLSIHTTSGPPSSAQWPCRAQYVHRGSDVLLWHRTQKVYHPLSRIVDTYYIGYTIIYRVSSIHITSGPPSSAQWLCQAQYGHRGYTIICPVAVPSTVRSPWVQRPSVASNTKGVPPSIAYRRYVLHQVHHHLSRIVDTYYIGSTIICPVAVPSTVREQRVKRPSVPSNTKGVPPSIAYRRYILHRVHHHLSRIVDTYYIGSTIICPVAVPSTVRAPRVQRPSVASNTKGVPPFFAYRQYILHRVHHHLSRIVYTYYIGYTIIYRVHHHLSRIVDTYYIGSTIICPVALPSTVRALRVQRPSVASNTKGVPLSIAYRRYIIHRVHHHLLRIFDTYYIGYTIIYRVSSIHTTSGTPSSIAYCRYILHRVHHHLPSDRAEHSTCTAGPTSFFGIEHKRRTTLYRISSIHTTSGTPSSIAYLRYILHRVHHHLSRIVDTYYIRYTIIYCVLSIHTTSGPPSSAQWPCQAQYVHRGSDVLLWHRTQKVYHPLSRIVDTYYIGYTIIYRVSSIHITSGPPSSAQWLCQAQYGHRGYTIICPVAVPSTVRSPWVQRPSVASNTKGVPPSIAYRRYVLHQVHHHLSRIVDTYYIGSTIICPVAVPSTVRERRVKRPSVPSNTKGVPPSIAYRRYILHRVHHHLSRIVDTYYIGSTIICPVAVPSTVRAPRVQRPSVASNTKGVPPSIAYRRYILHRVHHHLSRIVDTYYIRSTIICPVVVPSTVRAPRVQRPSVASNTKGVPPSIAYRRYILHRVHYHLSRIAD
ncbi:hypothetical protein NDU88_006543 [Pleurodeles waltl]|uniref:Uncharacterized protein n=1 Tax=Pleurodeles waltl TaxID=8319 RepID=A0AAV7L7L5_PLEWA|nr:hypothetical protein NDU88_006543 [Pleurodeles waltl]